MRRKFCCVCRDLLREGGVILMLSGFTALCCAIAVIFIDVLDGGDDGSMLGLLLAVAVGGFLCLPMLRLAALLPRRIGRASKCHACLIDGTPKADHRWLGAGISGQDPDHSGVRPCVRVKDDEDRRNSSLPEGD